MKDLLYLMLRAASSCQPPLLFTYPLGKLGLALGRKALPYTHNYLKWHRPSKYFNVLTMHYSLYFQWCVIEFCSLMQVVNGPRNLQFAEYQLFWVYLKIQPCDFLYNDTIQLMAWKAYHQRSCHIESSRQKISLHIVTCPSICIKVYLT